MRTLMPWTRMTGTEMDRLLNRFLEGKLEEESSAGAEWAPSMDVSETKDSLIAKLEVPGTDPRGHPDLPAGAAQAARLDARPIVTRRGSKYLANSCSEPEY
jgi:hypothetical protein